MKTSVGGTELTAGFSYDKAGNLTSRPVESRTQEPTWVAGVDRWHAADGEQHHQGVGQMP